MSVEFLTGLFAGLIGGLLLALLLDIIGTWVLEGWVLHLSPSLRERIRRRETEKDGEEQ